MVCVSLLSTSSKIKACGPSEQLILSELLALLTSSSLRQCAEYHLCCGIVSIFKCKETMQFKLARQLHMSIIHVAQIMDSPGLARAFFLISSS